MEGMQVVCQCLSFLEGVFRQKLTRFAEITFVLKSPEDKGPHERPESRSVPQDAVYPSFIGLPRH